MSAQVAAQRSQRTREKQTAASLRRAQNTPAANDDSYDTPHIKRSPGARNTGDSLKKTTAKGVGVRAGLGKVHNVARSVQNPLAYARTRVEKKADDYMTRRYTEAMQKNKLRRLQRITKRAQAAQKHPVSLVNPTVDSIYFFIILIAIFKDSLDLVGIGSLPAIGTIVTFIVSLTIMFMLIIASASGRRQKAQQRINRLLILLTGTIVEAFFFGLNFFPIETLTALIIYGTVVRERKKARKKQMKKQRRTQKRFARRYARAARS